MSLVDAARRLAGEGGEPSYWDVTGNRLLCTFCDGCENPAQTPPDVSHDPSCPWLAMPQIVAALEAAEATVDRCGNDDCAACAPLRAALRGEP